MQNKYTLLLILLLCWTSTYSQSSLKDVRMDSSRIAIIGNTIYRSYSEVNKGTEEDWKTRIRYAKLVVLDVHFETSTATMKSASLDPLNTLSTILVDNPSFKIEINGHTDNIGDHKKNLKLSKKRAKVVKTYLKKRGIKAKRIKSNGYGDTQPICDSPCSDNRRVEFKLNKSVKNNKRK